MSHAATVAKTLRAGPLLASEIVTGYRYTERRYSYRAVNPVLEAVFAR